MSAWTCRHTDGKVVQKIVPPRPRIPWWKGPGADSEEKQEPASDIDKARMDSLNVLDPEGPIREADIAIPPVCEGPLPPNSSQSSNTSRAAPCVLALDRF